MHVTVCDVGRSRVEVTRGRLRDATPGKEKV
jgi:hypothetical protein